MNELNQKRERIEHVWRDLIWKYKTLQNQVNFEYQSDSNYTGIILGYLNDTCDFLSETNFSSNSGFNNIFISNTSLLQAIYIQQDFIEELHKIFKTKNDKRNLKKDSNYTINREIRNEIVGHPLRKIDGKLISASLFGYHPDDDSITYLRYHKEKNFKFEKMSYQIPEIINRHKLFLEKNYNIILNRIKIILIRFLKEISHVEVLLKDEEKFLDLLDVVEAKFEAIFKSDYIYDKESLKKIYKKKNIHKRYSNVLDQFYNDLKEYLFEIKYSIDNVINPKVEVYDPNFFENLEIEFTNEPDDLENHPNYIYDIGKLAENRDLEKFEFHSHFIRTEFIQNKTICKELGHMKNNIDQKIEYYSSLYLIQNIIT